MIGTLYFLLTILQATLFPGSTSAAIQFRASEAMMMLALYSPWAIYGLTIGCCVANISGGIPLDIVIGGFATLLAGILIYRTRRITVKGFPLLSLLFPALCNGIIIGAEIQLLYVGFWNWTGFLIQAGCVALGEIGVSVILGIPFYYYCQKIHLDTKLKMR